MAEFRSNTNLQVISLNDINNLLAYFAKNTYSPADTSPIITDALNRSQALMEADYKTFTVNNENGDLSTNYPSQIIILDQEIIHGTPSNTQLSAQRTTTKTIYENNWDANKIQDLINKARFARCRTRFPVPVILYKGKHICRSSTLSGGPEIYGRSSLGYFIPGSEEQPDSAAASKPSKSDWQLFDKVRSADIKLLQAYNVATIVDFMVENKKVKYGVNVTSSEKVDKERRYAEFKIIPLPYPGCEFFKDFRDNNYQAEGLVFDWTQSHVDAKINVPDDLVSSQLQINWNNYTHWDLIEITQNYMKLMLKYLQDTTNGLLIHCISGWDRTPLFVSLLRLSLWADGVAHRSLDAQQILYLTVAYDWVLFGHHLVDRLDKGEEIFFFCFYMLKYLTSDEYSISSRLKFKCDNRSDRSSSSQSDSECHMENLILDADIRGSNISLNSSSSSTQEQMWVQASDETNGNEVLPILEVATPARSPSSRRTSPVSVPVSSRLRQRQESSSSLSVGSWQVITATGSVRGSDSNSDTNGLNGNNTSSTTTLVDEDTFYNQEGINRKKRLLKIRELFYNCYSKSVGLRMPNGEMTTLAAILGNIAEKVGFSRN